MKKPDIWSSDMQQKASGDVFTAFCGLKLEALPTFLYTRLEIASEAMRNDGYMKKIMQETQASLKAKAREIRDELNALDLD